MLDCARALCGKFDVAAEIEADGGTAAPLAGDLARRDAWRALYSAAREAYRSLSVLVHSASPPRIETQTALQVSEDEWDAMVDTNLRAGFFPAQAAARDMRAGNLAGRIVLMTSLHAHTPRNLPHYSAAKAGQVMVVRELARALGSAGIRVNGIAPGAVPGGGFRGDPVALGRQIALGRVARPEEIARAVMMLLDNELAGYITGEVLAVDGGLDQFNWMQPPANP
ncbi:MAG: SDR family oxidoreductase [Gammaproteobacteria bacterium]|nr:SDR family oxidoreductase [Gammaproteobacteria bacterium]